MSVDGPLVSFVDEPPPSGSYGLPPDVTLLTDVVAATTDGSDDAMAPPSPPVSPTRGENTPLLEHAAGAGGEHEDDMNHFPDDPEYTALMAQVCFWHVMFVVSKSMHYFF